MTCLLECDTYMYAASANGALRKWSLPFDPTKVEFRGQMWMHNKVRLPSRRRHGQQARGTKNQPFPLFSGLFVREPLGTARLAGYQRHGALEVQRR